MTIEIKRLDEDRWQDYRTLRLEALQKEPLAFASSFEEEETRPEAFWRSSTKNFIFAMADAQPVGMAGMFHNNHIKTNHVVEIFGVYVKKEYRGQGIGKRLIEIILTEVKNLKGVTKVKIGVNPTQTAAEHIYRKMGFKTVGHLKKEMCYNGKLYDELWMEKHL